MNVGVLSRGYEPFVFVDGDDYSGISIEIWERVADKLNIDYTYVDAGDSLNKAYDNLVAGKYDMLIGPFSVNEKRYQQVDFTTPYYISKIGLFIPRKPLYERILSLLLKIIIAISIIMIICFLINMVYIKYELKVKPDFKKGFNITFENAFSLLQGETMLHPKTRIGKFILFIYALIGLILLALVISSIRTAIDPNTADDKSIYSYVKNKSVVSRKNSKAERLVKKLKGIPHSISYQKHKKNYSYGDLLDEFLKTPQKLSAVIGDIPYLKYTINKGGEKYSSLKLHNDMLALNTYAFPIRKNNKLLAKIDFEMVKNKDDRIHQLIVSKYLGPALSIQANF